MKQRKHISRDIRGRSNYSKQTNKTRDEALIKGASNEVQSLLPSGVILQEYEYASEGAADRIIAMAEEEQNKRQMREDDYLRFYKKTIRVGQVFGFIILLAVVVAFYLLAAAGKDQAAVVLLGLTLTVAFMSSIVFTMMNRVPASVKRQEKRAKPRRNGPSNHQRSSNKRRSNKHKYQKKTHHDSGDSKPSNRNQNRRRSHKEAA